MVGIWAPVILVGSLFQAVTAAPLAERAATVGLIRGVRDPIYHLYLQASPKNSPFPLLLFYSLCPPCRLPSDISLETLPVLGPEKSGESFTIGGTIQSRNTSQYINIVTASTSYKPIVFAATGETTAWGLEGDTIITVQGSTFGRRKYYGFFLKFEGEGSGGVKVMNSESGDVLIFLTELNWLACKSSDNGYYDVFLQTGSDTPSGRSCSNYQTLHLPCLC